MKILILALGLLLTINVYASGIYGNLYDSSDLLTPQGQFEQKRKEETPSIDEEKKRRSKHQSEQLQSVGPDEEELKKLRR
jgi:membrane protein involved in colicin uptake